MKITNEHRYHLKVEGHRGTWYVIDEGYDSRGIKLYLLEHETYGEDAAHIIVTTNLKIVMEDVHNGFLDLVGNI